MLAEDETLGVSNALGGAEMLHASLTVAARQVRPNHSITGDLQRVARSVSAPMSRSAPGDRDTGRGQAPQSHAC
jgi:hypothetical protein